MFDQTNVFLQFWPDFWGATVKRTSKSDSASNFALDTPIWRSVRPKIMKTWLAPNWWYDIMIPGYDTVMRIYAWKWKLLVFEESCTFWHHRQILLEKWPQRFWISALYDFWRRGKKWNNEKNPDFLWKIAFTKTETLDDDDCRYDNMIIWYDDNMILWYYDTKPHICKIKPHICKLKPHICKAKAAYMQS